MRNANNPPTDLAGTVGSSIGVVPHVEHTGVPSPRGDGDDWNRAKECAEVAWYDHESINENMTAMDQMMQKQR